MVLTLQSVSVRKTELEPWAMNMTHTYVLQEGCFVCPITCTDLVSRVRFAQ